MKKNNFQHHININPCLNGVIVEIGCKRAVFGTLVEATEELARFAKDPKGVAKEYGQTYHTQEEENSNCKVGYACEPTPTLNGGY
jgi:hypothetical protein